MDCRDRHGKNDGQKCRSNGDEGQKLWLFGKLGCLVEKFVERIKVMVKERVSGNFNIETYLK
jgi:hypothetical protein